MAKASKVTSPAKFDSEIQLGPIERLKPSDRYARTHSNAQINQIAASIRECIISAKLWRAGEQKVKGELVQWDPASTPGWQGAAKSST